MKKDGIQPLNRKIQRAWELRFDQRIEDCRYLVAEIASALAVTFREMDVDLLITCSRFENLAQAILLDASLARVDGDMERSRRQIALVGAATRKLGIPAIFALSLQKGLTAFVDADYSSALESFLAAKAVARDSMERCLSLINCLFSLEYLGLPFSSTREQVERERRTAQLPDQIEQQLLAFDYRQAFRSGRLDSVLTSREKTAASQAKYFQLWVAELPFAFERRSRFKREIELFVSECQKLHQHSYRVRTLLGLTHPEDLREFRVPELADRIYLWCWKWLTDSQGFPIHQLGSLLDLVRGFGPAQLAAEDYQMVRNVILWLSLFSRTSLTDANSALARLKPSRTPSFPIFDYEEQMVRYFFALRDREPHAAKALIRQLRAHPVHQIKSLRLPVVAESIATQSKAPIPGFERLTGGLISLFARGDVADPEAVLIDTATGELKRSRESQISLPMSAGFELLKDRKTVPIAEFLWKCFGLRNYDPMVHDTKIFNLLARMRKFAPESLSLGVKSGNVRAVASDPFWEKIRIRTHHPLSDEVSGCDAWFRLLAGKSSVEARKPDPDHFVRPALLLKKLRGSKELRRAEIERITGKSRATANRVIARWLEQGTLIRIGKARNTRYVLQSVLADVL